MPHGDDLLLGQLVEYHERYDLRTSFGYVTLFIYHVPLFLSPSTFALTILFLFIPPIRRHFLPNTCLQLVDVENSHSALDLCGIVLSAHAFTLQHSSCLYHFAFRF